MVVDNNAIQGQITRRTALRVGGGFLLPFAGECAIPRAAKQNHSDLFVFMSPDSDRLVIAVAFIDQQNQWKVLSLANYRSAQKLLCCSAFISVMKAAELWNWDNLSTPFESSRLVARRMDSATDFAVL